MQIPTTLSNAPRQRLRLILSLLLGFLFIVGFVGALIMPIFVSDSFPSREFTEQIRPFWVGGAAAFVTLALFISLFLLKPQNAPNNRNPISVPKALLGLLMLVGMVGAEFAASTNTIERIAVRLSAKTDAYYVTDARRWFVSGKGGCVGGLGATWYDPFIHDFPFHCPTFPLFQRDDGRISREAIVHVWHGVDGIRVQTVHALDSELGQLDLTALKAKNPLPAYP